MKCVFVALFLLLASNQLLAQDVNLTYVGNMGVVVGNGEHSVIIDGLHTFYKADYDYPNNKVLNNIYHARYGVYDSIDIALTTHMHGDHFNSKMVDQFLAHNSNSSYIAASQCTNTLSTSNQIVTAPYNEQILLYQKEGIKIEAFQIDHGGANHKGIQNLAFIIEIAGITFLHVGDTSWEVAKKHLKKHRIREIDIDVTILPYWLVTSTSGYQQFEELVGAKRIIATHVSPAEYKSFKNKSTRALVYLTEKGQHIKFK